MLGAQIGVHEYLARMGEEVARLDTDAIEALSDAIYQRYLSGRFVYIIGNGGSAANASHLCEDLGKSSLADFENQKRLKVLSLTDNTPYILAWANDTSFERIFVEQLKNFGEAGDLLIAISGSGNSPNILAAVEWANAHGIETFGITGFNGGKLLKMADRSLHCRLDDMGIVESLHQIAFHYVLDDLHGKINGLKKRAAA
jgi:D-sedoheptulose 7-phosphate isomerase